MLVELSVNPLCRNDLTRQYRLTSIHGVGAMEPRFRTFLIDTLNWVDGSNVSIRELRAHLQSTLNHELEYASPIQDTATRSTHTRTPDLKISFGPLSRAPESSSTVRVYDVSRVWDPSTRQHAFHNGKHYAMLEASCRHAHLYTDLLQPLAKDMQENPSVEIYIACEHGRHRSASCAWLVHLLFENLLIPHSFPDSWTHSSHPHDAEPCEACCGELSDALLSDLKCRWNAAHRKRRS